MRKLWIIGLCLVLVACETTTQAPVTQEQRPVEEPVVVAPIEPPAEETDIKEASSLEDEEPIEVEPEVRIEAPEGSIAEIQSLTNFSNVPTLFEGVRFVATGNEGFTNEVHQNDGRNFPVGYFKAFYRTGHTIDIQISSHNPIQNYEPFVAHAHRLGKTIGQLPFVLQDQIAQIVLVDWSSEPMQLEGSTLRVGHDTMHQLRDRNETFVELFSILKGNQTLQTLRFDERDYWLGLWWLGEQIEDRLDANEQTTDVLITTSVRNGYEEFLLPQHATMNIATGSLAPGMVTPDDPSALIEVVYVKQATRYHARGATWTGKLSGPFQAHVFEARFAEGSTMNVVVETSIARSQAEQIANEVAFMYGQAPALLRAGMRDFIMLPGSGHPSSGPVTTFYVDIFYRMGEMIEEGLIHDMAHASLDWPARNEVYDITDNVTLLPHPGVTTREGWLNAARLDDYYVSTYAKDNPEREDIAESIMPYLILRWRPERFDPYYLAFIEQVMPNRIAYLDTFDFGFPVDDQ
jgi:hypothetical protein